MDTTELYDIARRTAESLTEIGQTDENGDYLSYEDIGEYLSEGVLSISRSQDLQSDGWVTTNYTLCVGCGGPNVDICTAGYVRVAWWSDPIYHYVTPQQKEILGEIFEWLSEVYE